MYKFVASFLVWPENFAFILLSLIQFVSKIPGFSSIFKLLYNIDKRLETSVWIQFKKSVGLAAG
jgi:dihydroorotate dehydrogenase